MDAMTFEIFAQVTDWGLPLSGSALMVCLLYLATAFTAMTCLVAADRADGPRAPADEARPGGEGPPDGPTGPIARPLDDPRGPRDEDGRASLSRMSLTTDIPGPREPRAELSRLGLLMPSVDDPERRGPA